MTLNKRHCLLILLLPFAYLTWLSIRVQWQVPEFERIFADFKLTLSTTTQLLLATYRYWPVCPVVVALGIIDFARRTEVQAVYFVGLFLVTGLLALVLQEWLVEGTWGVFFNLSSSLS